ncbi:hypothetical protein ABZ502_11960 [Streptomyces abikoensis]|uniref:hypothetical protein n=1 Tax=Streptomyces abikoensis TaxID=97398 RepID=UPI0033C4BD57
MDDEWIFTEVAGGMPRSAAEFALMMFAASRNGEFNATDPTLEAVVGHPVKTVREVLEAVGIDCPRRERRGVGGARWWSPAPPTGTVLLLVVGFCLVHRTCFG